MLLTFVLVLGEAVGVAMVFPLLESFNESESPARISNWITGSLATAGLQTNFQTILLTIATVFILKGFAEFLCHSSVAHIQSKLAWRLQSQMLDAIGNMTISYYSSKNAGYFANLISQEIQRFVLAFKAFANCTIQAMLLLGYSILGMIIAWKFAFTALICGCAFLVFPFINRRLRAMSRARVADVATVNSQLIQFLHSFKYVVATGFNRNLTDKSEKKLEKISRSNRGIELTLAFTRAIQEPLAVVLIVGLMLIQVSIFKESKVSVFVATIVFYRSVNVALRVQSEWQHCLTHIGSVETVDAEFRSLQDKKEESGTKQISKFQNEIVFEDVGFAYDVDRPVLVDIDLRISKNQMFALVGESGAGKTTLVDLLTLILKPSSGSITIDGVDSEEIELQSWRKQIGYVSQDSVIFDDTIANNISLWDEDSGRDPQQMREKIQCAVEQAHLADFIDTLPDGLETKVGERGVRLSGGQRQRLFIARELYKKPALLILDEASSALDTESETAVQRSIDSLRGHITVVIIAHRLSTIRNVDHVYVLEQGKIVEQGSYQELQSCSGSKFQTMIASQNLS